MPLTFSNVVSPAQSALNNKLNPQPISAIRPNLSLIAQKPAAQIAQTPTNPSANLSLGNVAGPQSTGITNRNVLPPQLQSSSTASTLPVAKPQPLASTVLNTGSAQPPSSSSVDTNYQLKPGEAQSDYITRIAGYNATKNGVANPYSAPPTTGNTYSAPANQTTGLTAPPTPTYGGLIGSIASTAQDIGQQGQMTPEEVAARKALAGVADTKSGINQSFAEWQAANAKDAIPVEFQQGRAQVEQNLQANRLAAVGQHEQALSQGVSALAAERAANTGAYQGEASALGTAAGYAQPQLSQYGQNYYNPLTAGQPGQGGDIGGVITQYAQGLANGTLPYSSIPSTITGNPVLNAQLLQAAGGSNFNLNSALGSSAAQQSNAQLGGTAVQQANASTYQNALPQYYQMQAQLQNVEGLGNMLLQTAAGGQVNPFDARFANQTVAQFQSQLSSPERTRFQETLNNFQGAASALLANSSGQIPTDVSSSINALGTGTLSLGALKALVDQAQKNGSIKLQSQGAIVNSSLDALRAGTSASIQPNQAASGAKGWL